MRANTICLIAGTIAVAASAHADIEPGDIVSLTRNGLYLGRVVDFNYDSTRSYNAAAEAAGGQAAAGVVKFQINTINGNPADGVLNTFCVEIQEQFPDDPITYNVVEPGNGTFPEENPPGALVATQVTMLQDLYSRYYNTSVIADGQTWSQGQDDAAAFQWVVWEITHENFSDENDIDQMKAELSITLGAMQITDTANFTDALASANVMIQALGTGGWTAGMELFGLTNATNQDLLIVVPSPAIAALAGLGLVGMRRRRR